MNKHKCPENYKHSCVNFLVMSNIMCFVKDVIFNHPTLSDYQNICLKQTIKQKINVIKCYSQYNI